MALGSRRMTHSKLLTSVCPCAITETSIVKLLAENTHIGEKLQILRDSNSHQHFTKEWLY